MDESHRGLTGPERRLHDEIGFVGLRAHATAAAVIQICAELRTAGVFGDDAMSRIKDAVAREIALSQTRGGYQQEFERARARLDALFSGRATLNREGAERSSGEPQARCG